MVAIPEEQQNKGGRPVGSTSKISKLQRTANKLEQMARLDALPLIQKSLDGKSVEKDQLATAKWTVTAAKDFHNAVLSEKRAKAVKDEDGNPVIPEVDEDADNDDAPAKFTLKIVEAV